MTKAIKVLGVVGLCGAATLFLAGISNLSIVATIGLVVLFGCAAAVIMCSVIKGYNPVKS